MRSLLSAFLALAIVVGLAPSALAGDRYYERRVVIERADPGAVVAGAIAGLALGAILGGALADQRRVEYRYYQAPRPAGPRWSYQSRYYQPTYRFGPTIKCTGNIYHNGRYYKDQYTRIPCR